MLPPEHLHQLILKFREAIEAVGNIRDIMLDYNQWDGRSSTVIVTDECNLRCTYCYCHKTPRMMTWEVAKDYINYIFESNRHLSEVPKALQLKIDHRKIFEFIGGEPLLQSDLMFQCMDYIIEKTMELPENHPWRREDWDCDCGQVHKNPGIRFMVSTNGLLLVDPGIQQRLLKWKEYTYLGVTLDGTKEMHDLCRRTVDGEGSYETVMSAWRWMMKTFTPCTKTTKSTIAHENIDYIFEIVKFFYDLGLTSLAQNCVFENVWHRGDQHRLLQQLFKVADFMLDKQRYKQMKLRWLSPFYFSPSETTNKWCGAGTYMDCCDAEGIIYPCLRFKELKQRPPFVLGNIKIGKDQEILDRFESEAENTIFSEDNKGLTHLKQCSECPVSSQCADCQAFAYDCFGSLTAKSPFICPMHKAACVANIYFFSRLLNIPVDRTYLENSLEEWTKTDYFSTDGDYNAWLSQQTQQK